MILTHCAIQMSRDADGGKLLGATEALLRHGKKLPPWEQALLERVKACLSERLGLDELERLAREGRAMSRETVIAFGLKLSMEISRADLKLHERARFQ